VNKENDLNLNVEDIELEEKEDKNWWEKFKEKIEDEPQARKLIEVVEKADKMRTKKYLDKAIAEVQKSKYLQKKGNEYIRLGFERKLRTISKGIERKISDNFGSLIKYLREQKGLSLQALGDMTGISPSYIHRIEKGERHAPTVKIIEKLADALGVSFVELLKVAKIEIDDAPADNHVYELEKFILSNNVSYSGKEEPIKKKEKELLVKIINTIVNSEWSETSKHLETVEIITLIDKFKKTQRS